MRVASSLVCVLLPVLVAGCGDPGYVAPSAPEPDPASTLRVLVLTDEYLPIPDARVRLVELDLQEQTTEAGEAIFRVDHPGRFLVQASRSGFYSNRTLVELGESADVTTRLWLHDAPHEQFVIDTALYDGTCGYAVHVQGGALGAGDCSDLPGMPHGRFGWRLTHGLESMELELRFPHQLGGLDRMRLAVRIPDAGPFADGRLEIEATGTSPVRLTIPPGLITPAMREGGHQVELLARAPADDVASAGAMQRFLLVAEAFYYWPAPAVE